MTRPAISRHSSLRAWIPWLALATLWAGAFSLACLVSARPLDRQAMEPVRSVTGALLGASRLGLSSYFYEMADLYFHRGIEHTVTEGFQDSLFQSALSEVSPRGHLHIAGSNVKEMMPWLWVAIEMDPHNVDLYLVAAFWLAGDGNRPDLADEILRLGQCEIPFSYQIQLERGRIGLKHGNLAAAKGAFDAGLAFWPGKDDPNSQGTRADRASLLLYRALLHEADGERPEAIVQLREILKMFPERKSLESRIRTLEAGNEPSLLASGLWRSILQQEDEARLAREEEEHGHEPAEHGTGTNESPVPGRHQHD
jgi:hypothetical protein